MTDNCTNSQECCPSAVFRDPIPGIFAAMQSLVWTIPCLPPTPSWPDPRYSCPCNNPTDQVTTLQGDSGELYDVTLLFRGVFELATYTGGTVIAGTGGYMQESGSNTYDGHNVYSLLISNPAQVYFLNRWDGIVSYSPCYSVRYTATVRIAGGATITLRAVSTDGGQVTNYSGQVAPVVTGDPPISVPQPYPNYGQFLQMDAIAID